ncbi:MAG: LacI family DNA-binding transcriptional regulator [Oscillospiraceae bacterium]|nr:LacI family DNA-binding transcriptional regulator [Oscillospiraceae bacterium]
MTIKDLAVKTGYAVGTVSRALNDHPNVSDKARKAILQAAQECGFELNQNAKQLKQQHSNTILVVVKGNNNELFSEMLEFIQPLISRTRYQLAVDYNDEDDNEVIRAVQLCREKKPLGLMFLGGNSRNFSQDFSKIDIPAVLVTNDASGLKFDNLSSVCTDDAAAAQQAVETLIALGHRKIAVIGGDRQTSDTSHLRYEGCQRAFQAHGIDFDPERDYQGVRYSYQDGFNAIRTLLKTGREFTAVFACADVMAIGAIRALWEAGRRVPEDVSVMGVDGLPLGSFLVPQLSGISQSVQGMAQRAVEILLSGIEQGTGAVHETVPFGINQRESVRRIDIKG